MAKVKKKVAASPAQASAATERLKILSTYVNACNDTSLLDAFGQVEGGNALYDLFIQAVNAEIESLFSTEDNTAAAVDSLQEKFDTLDEQLAGFSRFVGNLSHEKLFAVLAIVMKNFVGVEVEVPQSPQVPYQARKKPTKKVVKQDAAPEPVEATETEEKAETTEKPSLTKRFAASSSTRPPPDRPPALTMPPRGGGMLGF